MNQRKNYLKNSNLFSIMQTASLIVRSAHVSITASIMEEVFAQHGTISHVDTAEKNGPKGHYKQFVIHYSEICPGRASQDFWRRIQMKEVVSVVYNAKENFVKVCLHDGPQKSAPSSAKEEDAWNTASAVITIVENPTKMAPAAKAPAPMPVQVPAKAEAPLTSVEKNRRKQISVAMDSFQEDMKKHYDAAYEKALSEETSRPKSSQAIEKNRQTQLAASTKKAEEEVEKMQKLYDNMTNVEQIDAFKSLKEATKAMILKKVKSDAVLSVAKDETKAIPIPSIVSVSAVESEETKPTGEEKEDKDDDDEEEEEDERMFFLHATIDSLMGGSNSSCERSSESRSSGRQQNGRRHISNEEIVERLFPTPVKRISCNYFDVDAPTEVARAIDYGPAILPPSIKERRKRRQEEKERNAAAAAAAAAAIMEQGQDQEQDQGQDQEQHQDEAPPKA
jgi:hypothetical protein